MKNLSVILSLLMLFLYACGGDASSSGTADKSSSAKIKDLSIPDDNCVFVTKGMIQQWFDVDESELEEEVDAISSSPEYSKCGYTWKKENYDELIEKYMEYMLSSTSSGEMDISDISKLESPMNSILVGGFKKYDDIESAQIQFKNLHQVPTEEDLQKLKGEIDKKAGEENLSEQQKELGKKLGGGIAAALKFIPVSGIGEEAFYSELDKSLDVRYGTLTFKVYVNTKSGQEKDIEIAKEIAASVLKKL